MSKFLQRESQAEQRNTIASRTLGGGRLPQQVDGNTDAHSDSHHAANDNSCALAPVRAEAAAARIDQSLLLAHGFASNGIKHAQTMCLCAEEANAA